MPKSFRTSFEQLDNEIHNFIMLEESLDGMMCSLHKAATKSESPRTVKFSSAPKRPETATTPHRNKKRKNLNVSKFKPASTSEESWTATFKSTSSIEPTVTEHKSRTRNYAKKGKIVSENSRCACNQITTKSESVTLEKVNSCPNRTSSSSNVTSRKQRDRSKSLDNHTFLHMCSTEQHNVPDANPGNQMMLELKNEIDKMKKELWNATKGKLEVVQASNTLREDYNSMLHNKEELMKQIYQLETDNQQLRQQLEQRKQVNEAATKEISNARELLKVYEDKVGLLHKQAVKSSKIMNASKDKLCQCIEEKDGQINLLSESNKQLQELLQDKDQKYDKLNEKCSLLQAKMLENEKKYGELTQTNEKFCECVKTLEYQLQKSLTESENYREDIRKLEQEISTLKSDMSLKRDEKVRKLKDKFHHIICECKEQDMQNKEEISQLTSRISELETEKMNQKLELESTINNLRNNLEMLQKQYEEALDKISELENYATKCKSLEENFRIHCENSLKKELFYQHEKKEMCKLVDELTTTIKQHKMTLLELSEVNKRQEALLKSQSKDLFSKEEQIKQAESVIEMMKNRSLELEQQLDSLKSSASSDTCNNEGCAKLRQKLEDLTTKLEEARDNQLLKDKIIEDNTKTIFCLQNQISERNKELSKSVEDARKSEKEVSMIRNELLEKQSELDQEIEENEHLVQKLERLEFQKNQLIMELHGLEKALFGQLQQHEMNEKQIIAHLKSEIEKRQKGWEMEKQIMGQEKDRALYAAKFATQKLLETVTDFQKQVEAQKQVQKMLTCMLQDKEEQLNVVKSKMSSITAIAAAANDELDFPTQELFRRSCKTSCSANCSISQLPTSSTSRYSSCSDQTPKLSAPEPTDIIHQHLFELLGDVRPTKEVR